MHSLRALPDASTSSTCIDRLRDIVGPDAGDACFAAVGDGGS